MTNGLDPNKTLAEIVTGHPAAARVFRTRGIDFCCGGRVTIDAWCAKHGVDAGEVRREVDEVLAGEAERQDSNGVRALATPALIERIVTTHHGYTRRVLPHVRALAEKVARVHGDHQPSLRALGDVVRTLGDTLLPHLDDEERSLFPSMLTNTESAEARAAMLREMDREHRVVGDQLRILRRLADDFRTPEWACTSYRTLFAELESLEDDLLRHIHLENHVLAPRFSA